MASRVPSEDPLAPLDSPQVPSPRGPVWPEPLFLDPVKGQGLASITVHGARSMEEITTWLRTLYTYLKWDNDPKQNSGETRYLRKLSVRL